MMRGSAPLSSIVLKKMGAILPPMHRPWPRLLGTKGMSSPMYHSTELVADLRDEPVPTTSPTYTSWKPFSLSSTICACASWIPCGEDGKGCAQAEGGWVAPEGQGSA